MSDSFRAKLVKCPFYKHDKKNMIKCEGIIPDTISTITFLRAGDKKIQMQLFCEKEYKKCEHYAAVESFKYD